MNNKSTISLLGCGWLGFPLAEKLLASGFFVKGSTTSPDKIHVLRQTGIDPYLVQFSVSKNAADLNRFLESDCLVVLIPPGRSADNGFDNYQLMVDVLCSLIPSSALKKLILVSSTSVYADDAEIVTESSTRFSTGLSPKMLLRTESRLAQLPCAVSIIRFAGLIGPARHPGRFFAGKINVPNGFSPVNLIHQEDAIGLIEMLITSEDVTGIWNGCTPDHPSRSDFYTLAADVLDVEKPRFLQEKNYWKLISSERIQNLTYEFKVPSLMNWLKSGLR